MVNSGTRPLRDCKAADTIILGGEFHGFRSIEVTGWTGVGLADLVGIMISSDMEKTGTFECSHKLINQLHSNVVYSWRANSISIPTDCPQRDEQ